MRRLLVLFVVFLLSPAAWSALLPITVMYKKDTVTSADRLDPAVQSALQVFEEKFLEAGYRVIQPDPKIYDRLDRAQGVVVTFAADAGYSLLLDLVKGKRPYSGTEMTYAEVRIRARIYHGRLVLASVNELGSVAYKSAGAEDKAFESAARRSVQKAAIAIAERLQASPPAISMPSPSLVLDSAGAMPVEVQAAVPTGNKWALMIGVSDFQHVCRISGMCGNPLPGVKVDMQSMRAALSSLGVAESRMTWLLDDQATTGNVRRALARIREVAEPDDLVYIYLSTHGMPKEGGLSGFGIPITYDFTQNNFIDFEEFRSAIGALRANNVIWINDTCHSGLAAEGLVTIEIGSRDFGIAPPSAFDPSAAASLKSKNIAVLSSATGNQKAADLGPKGGLFSAVFASGVRQLSEAGGRQLPSIYAFYKDQVDGKVQSAFRELCSEKPVRDPRLCAQGAQQPVFAAQNAGKQLRM